MLNITVSDTNGAIMSHTAFPKTEERLRTLIKVIDTDRLRKGGVLACSFTTEKCFGMCCSLKVAVTAEEAEILTRLACDHSSELYRLGCEIKGNVITIDRPTGRHRLLHRRRTFNEVNKIVFEMITRKGSTAKLNIRRLQKTMHACVFLLKDGACALQRLAEQFGRHKWYYKPINCWKYPLSIKNGTLTVPSTFKNNIFPCYRHDTTPCYEALREELSFLGTMIGRDIVSEIKKK
ncbi:MAG: hypothetical protein JW938_06745 [Candidatus Omnitrophica bacterium]|nr:hypothetical protein [Candidatus Omnitrophota bacterium]